MFAFEKLDVYVKAHLLTQRVFKYSRSNRVNNIILDQLQRGVLSTVLNIAEGSGRQSLADCERYYVIARSSTFEVVTTMQVLKSLSKIEPHEYEEYYQLCDEMSRMLLQMIKLHTTK